MTKQRYVLDVDDIVRPGFLAGTNANQLIAGLNTYGTVPLAVSVGGLGSNTFTDGQGLVFNQHIGQFQSTPGVDLSGYFSKTALDALFSGHVGGISSGKYLIDWAQVINPPTIPTPAFCNGVVRAKCVADTISLLGVSDTTVASFALSLPASNHWVMFQLVFTCTLSLIDGESGTVVNLRAYDAIAGAELTDLMDTRTGISDTHSTAGGDGGDVVEVVYSATGVPNNINTLLTLVIKARTSAHGDIPTLRRGYIIGYYAQN